MGDHIHVTSPFQAGLTWLVTDKNNYHERHHFFSLEGAQAFIEQHQGSQCPLWRQPRQLMLERGFLHDEQGKVYICWCCGDHRTIFGIENSTINLDFHSGLCHGCSIKRSQATAFVTWEDWTETVQVPRQRQIEQKQYKVPGQRFVDANIFAGKLCACGKVYEAHSEQARGPHDLREPPESFWNRDWSKACRNYTLSVHAMNDETVP